MLSLSEIIAKAKRAAELNKDYQDKQKANPYNRDVNNFKKEVPLPDYFPTYATAVDYSERISIHSEINNFPAKLFSNRAPNQTGKEAEYLERNYKNITLPVYMDYISTITRGWNDNNWSIRYAKDEAQFETADQTFQKYVEEEIKLYGSIENFVKFVLPSIKTNDANGVIAIKPHDISYLKGEDGKYIESEDGQPQLDETKLYEPIPYYYSSKQVVDFELDHYYLIQMNEKSLVEYGNAKKYVGMVYEYYDENNIYIITQIGKYLDFRFDIKLYFNHNWNRVPVTQLKGVPKIVNNEILWQSPFLYCVDILDQVALNNSYLGAIIAACTFPYRIMVGDVCEFEDKNGNHCVDGYITRQDLDNHPRETCLGCNGTGLKDRISPLGVMLLRPKTRDNDGDSTFSNKPMEYISPGTETQTFLEEKISRDTEKARAILHLKTSNSVVKGSENMTATGMALDMQSLYAFVKTVSDQCFQIYEFILDAIGWQRYGTAYNKPILVYPNSFDFQSENDYFELIKKASDAKLPPFVIYTIMFKYLQSVYYNESQTAKVFNLITQTDRLVTFGTEDIALMIARGTVAKWESILHDSAIIFVDELVQENENFFEQEFETQKEQLIQKAKDKEAEIVPQQMNIKNSILAASQVVNDNLGKIPLALQQLALARMRADETGDKKLSNAIGKQMDDLLKQI